MALIERAGSPGTYCFSTPTASAARYFVEEGLLEKRLYEERPPRYEYWLTEKGRDLAPVRQGGQHTGGQGGVIERHGKSFRETRPVVDRPAPPPQPGTPARGNAALADGR